MVLVLIPSLHRDRSVWGPDVEAFRPERCAPELAAELPPNAWKPLGSGARACIGRPFAMREALLVQSMVLQRFDISLDNPRYELSLHEAFTIKPAGLVIRARRRRGRPAARAERSAQPDPRMPRGAVEPSGPKTPLMVLQGGNAGTSKVFSERLAGNAGANGFEASLLSLDEACDVLARDGAVVIVTASYGGQPPNNARAFVPHVEGLASDAVAGLRYAVFGCGNRQSARTYQAIPKRLDAALNLTGAERLLERGEADSGGDVFGAFEGWRDRPWPALTTAFGREATGDHLGDELQVQFVVGAREVALRLDGQRQGTIVRNDELADMTSPLGRSKRHIEIALPEGMNCRAGDYLAVLPRNHDDLADRAMRRLGLSADALVVLSRL